MEMWGLLQGLEGSVLHSKICKLQDRGKLGKFHVFGNVHAIVIVAPSLVMGAWSMHFC